MEVDRDGNILLKLKKQMCNTEFKNNNNMHFSY